MTDIEYNYIELGPNSGSRFSVVLGDVLITLVPKYNYSAACWVLDIYDAQDEIILAGLMLVPNVDILQPYPQIKRSLGSLILVEYTPGDYQSAAHLGTRTKLLWFPYEEEVVLP